jgi:hypothetical protein
MKTKIALIGLLSGALVVGLLGAPFAAATEDGVINGAAQPLYQTNTPVWALAAAGGVLYAGGDFTTVRPPGSAAGTNEVARNHLAAFETSTGNVTSWNPDADGRVQAMALSPDHSVLYVGGLFTHINGVFRNHLAAFSTANGSLTTWRPNANAGVASLAVGPDGTVYVGGNFTKINGIGAFPDSTPVSRIAAIGAAGSGLLDTNYRATADGAVQAIAYGPDLPGTPQDESRVILGGAFDVVDGVTHHGIAGTSPANGSYQPWAFDPVPADNSPPQGGGCCYSTVKTIVTDDQGHAFIGAEGTGGGVFDGTFAVNYVDGSRVWFDNCLGATQALVVLNGWVYDGSHMHDCQGQVVGGPPQLPNTWHHLVAESPVDGHIGHFFPNTTGNPIGPKVMTTDGEQLFVGGDFKFVNNKAQQGLTRFNAAPDTTGPKKPAVPAASGSYCAGQVRVTWTATDDLDDGLLTYKLFRDGTTLIDTQTATSVPWSHPVLHFTDNAADPAVTHTYSVQAFDGPNASAKSKSAPVSVSSTTDAYPCAVTTDGATQYWRLDETSGSTAADASGSGKTGIYQSSVNRGVGGAIADGNAAAGFTGSSSSFVTSSSVTVDPQAFSIEAWFKTTTNAGGKIVGLGSSQTGTSGNYDRHIYMKTNGQLVFGVWEGFAAVVTSPASYNNNAWHHVVGTIDSTNGMALYVDGAPVASHSVDSNGNYGFAEHYSGYWRVGGDNLSGWPGPTGNYFSGSIDDVAIYPFALGASQVADHFVKAH